MNELTPILTASLASDVYALTKQNNIADAMAFLNAKYGEILTFAEDDMLKAKTGGPWFIKCQTAFGFTMLGKGKLQGHAFFLFRGTQYLADWLTNFNVTASRSASGQPVHDGFNMAFKSMLPKLTDFMGVINKNKVTHIHCIGHSLGGALATLCGEWVKSNYDRKPYIYSYGSPRVGLYGFSYNCTKSIGAERIFRAYHRTDIVPCIPTWPYMHTPISGQDYFLPSPGLMPMAEYHGMDHYIDSVRGKSWADLAALQSETKTDKSVIDWLKVPAPIGITIAGLDLLGQAITYVLKQCLNATAWLISQTFTNSFTLMDQLAYILSKGIDIAETVSDLVLSLIQKIMCILGMKKVLKAEQLTREFIRNLLMRLQNKVNEITQATLSKILVNGRSI